MINNTEVIKLDRSRITIKLGDYVEYENEIYKISQLIDSNEVVGINIITNRACRLTKKNLKPISMSNIDKHINIYKDLSEIADSEYQEMEKRYLAIQPLLEDNLTRDDIIKHSKTVGVHYTTLYRWLRLYKSTGTLTGLISKTSGRIKGEKRLDYKIEKIIQNVINNYYLTKQKPSIQAVINKINIECKNNSLTAPGKNTVRNRIKDISEYEKLKKQGNRTIARTRFEPVPGKFEADYPLQLIEIDHTPVDLILVDDDTRKPIGRPWITLAIDIY
ncbi:MAG: helix-turn-helix domain-containing protein, partial [Sulfurovaceae bacterium]|nr:helix-turn-helix domain-containing protein [Sulfurovaceae bacterium]